MISESNLSSAHLRLARRLLLLAMPSMTTTLRAQDFLPYPPTSTAFVTEWTGDLLMYPVFGEF